MFEELDIMTIILLVGIIGVVSVFVFYLLKTYVTPKKMEELEEMINTGNIIPAIKRLQSLLEQNDKDPLVHYLLAEGYLKQRDISNAALEFRQVIKIGKFTAKISEAKVRSKLAKIYLENRSLEAAKKEFLILTKLEPSNAENFYQAGKLFSDANLIDKALSYFKKAVKVNPSHSKAHYLKGLIEYQINNTIEAKNSFMEAVKLEAELFDAHYHLGLCLKGQKDYEWAIKEFVTAMGDPKLRGKAYLAKGLCFMDREQFSNAIIEFDQALAHAPKSSELELNIRYYTGAAAERLRDFHIAISNWEHITNVNSKFKDVADKLKQYEGFRTDDAVKDFMIASPGKFESLSRQIIELMELNIIDLSVANDSEVHILATDQEGKWRSQKLTNRLIYIFRHTEPIQEKSIRIMYEDMRAKNATRGICMTTSEFTTQAQLFCQSRPIELESKKEMIRYLRTLN